MYENVRILTWTELCHNHTSLSVITSTVGGERKRDRQTERERENYDYEHSVIKPNAECLPSTRVI